MSERTIDGLVRRLDRVERESRRLKRVGMFLLIGIGALLIMGQVGSPKVPKTIEADQFVVKGSNGTKRAELIGGRLVLYDAKGKERIVLAALEYGAELVLISDKWSDVLLKTTKTGSALTLGNDDTSQITLHHERGGSVSMQLHSAGAESGGAYLEASRDQSRLTLSYNKRRAVLGTVQLEQQRTGTVSQIPSGLVLFNTQGQVIYKAP